MNEVAQAMIDDLPDFSDIVSRFTDRKNLGEDIQNNILIGSERQTTRMGLINGITWAAQQQPDHELMVDMQSWAGSILVDKESIFGRAAKRAELVEDNVEVEV